MGRVSDLLQPLRLGLVTSELTEPPNCPCEMRVSVVPPAQDLCVVIEGGLGAEEAPQGGLNRKQK